MDEQDFEGTLILERLAEIGQTDTFFSAIDSDDFAKVKSLLQKVQLDQDTIQIVLKKMCEAEG